MGTQVKRLNCPENKLFVREQRLRCFFSVADLGEIWTQYVNRRRHQSFRKTFPIFSLRVIYPTNLCVWLSAYRQTDKFMSQTDHSFL